ncbi:MAG: LytR/AlgR family response regulator transcription factor [Flammeovirgaceae bacterium]
MTKKIQAVVVDDEPLARDSVCLLLDKQPDIEVVASLGNGKEAITFLHQHEVKLLFLDIQMPQMSGFEVLANLPVDRLPHTIFITAYDQFALKAFEVNAIDYLLKPYSDQRFYKAVDRAKTWIYDHENQTNVPDLINHYLINQQFPKRLAVKERDQVIILKTEEIQWFKGAGAYVEVGTAHRNYLIYDSLKQLEVLLNPGDFIRIHKSTIINANYIQKLEPYFNGEYFITLFSGVQFKLSRNYKDRLKHIAHGF